MGQRGDHPIFGHVGIEFSVCRSRDDQDSEAAPSVVVRRHVHLVPEPLSLKWILSQQDQPQTIKTSRCTISRCVRYGARHMRLCFQVGITADADVCLPPDDQVLDAVRLLARWVILTARKALSLPAISTSQSDLLSRMPYTLTSIRQ